MTRTLLARERKKTMQGCWTSGLDAMGRRGSSAGERKKALEKNKKTIRFIVQAGGVEKEEGEGEGGGDELGDVC